jgi:hypothetical protein
MAGLFVETPRTEVGDRTRFGEPSLSELPSFVAPAGADNLLNVVRNQRSTAFATPSARVPLANRNRNAQTKNEFTPLLKSAAKNRLAMRDPEAKENHGVLATPAALKPGYNFDSPGMPEASSLMDSSMSLDHTPVGLAESSSAMSTPIALPQRGEMGMGGDGGNVLTLREQEAVSNSIKSSTDTS